MEALKGLNTYNSVLKYFLLFVLLVDMFLQRFLRNRGYGVENHGISFGLFSEAGLWMPMATLLIIVLLVVALWMNKTKGVWLILLILGGLGNSLSRLFLGSVWDYIYLPLLPFWFNLSDVMIFIGVSVLIYNEILEPARR